MELKFFILSFFLFCLAVKGSSWNNLNCPAPRAPDNGLSFIFRNGELVHFKCHPGYLMHGKAVSYCVNNSWTQTAPKCVSIRKGPSYNVNFHRNSHSIQYGLPQKDKIQQDKQRALFSWGTVYGDGPRRLPLINGIWPPQEQVEQVLALGPLSTPAPKSLIQEEVDIAELRHRQLEELRKQRYFTEEAVGKRQQVHRGHKKKTNAIMDDLTPRETILSLGSTEDGDAFSVAYAKSGADLDDHQVAHKHRHRKHKKHHNKRKELHAPDPFVTSRRSRVDSSGIPSYYINTNNLNKPFMRRKALINDVSELRQKPTEQIFRNRTRSMAMYDATCIEPMYRREVPKLAPQSPNAFVYRYETKRNKDYPFNRYMIVKYRCNSGYSFTDDSGQHLYCRNTRWVGEPPRCAERT